MFELAEFQCAQGQGLVESSGSFGFGIEEIPKCMNVKCNSLLVTGIKQEAENLSFYNGLYVRITGLKHAAFRKIAGRRRFLLAARKSESNPGKFKWVFEEEVAEIPSRFPLLESEPCEVEKAGHPQCASYWLRSGKPEFECLTDSEKAKTISGYNTKEFDTRIPIPGGAWMALKCEDIKMVEQVSGFTCVQLQKSLGCDYLLSETGTTLPPFLPLDSTVASICPGICGQCAECSTGCPVWFLGNKHCDSACNNSECLYDDGDCSSDAETTRLVASPEDPFYGSNPEDRQLEVCDDDVTKLTELGLSCEFLKLAAEQMNATEPCATKLKEMVTHLPMKLPSTFPIDTRIVDLCPSTCDCCDCKCRDVV